MVVLLLVAAGRGHSALLGAVAVDTEVERQKIFVISVGDFNETARERLQL